MSADNYILIRKDGDGYRAEMRFASCDYDDDAPVYETDPWFPTLESAREYAESECTEYGVSCDFPVEWKERAVEGAKWESVAVLGCDSAMEEADARLIALAPELASLVLDMADALRNVLDAPVVWPTTDYTELQIDSELIMRIDALLARLDRISTQTERSHALADERAAWAGAIGTPETGDCIGRSSAPVFSGEAPGRSACVCDPPDQVFSRTLCACGAMHTYCGKCGEQLDDCDPDPCCEDAGDCGEDCGTA